VRFYEMWAEMSSLVTIVLEFCFQVHLVFPEHEHANTKWRAARIYLAALCMLFDMLGGAVTVENPFDGDGVDENEYDALLKLELLTEKELMAMRNYRGVKCALCAKWALDILKKEIKVGSRKDTRAKYMDDFEHLTIKFQRQCYTIILQLQQPVPYCYFHVLKLQMIMMMMLLGYALVNVFEGNPVETFICYIVVVGTMLGLQEIAVAMSDPFGDDDADFDTTHMMSVLYDNVKELYNADTIWTEGSDAKLTYQKRRRFKDFGVSIHGYHIEDEVEKYELKKGLTAGYGQKGKVVKKIDGFVWGEIEMVWSRRGQAGRRVLQASL